MSQYTCGRCNSPVTRTTSKCPNCGVLLNGIKCSKCSFVYSQSLFNCPSCGTNNPNTFKETAWSGKTASMMFAVSFTIGAIVMWFLQFFPTRAMRFNTVFRVATNIFSMLAILLWIMVIVILKKSKNKEKARTNTNTTTPDQATTDTTAMDVLSAFDNLSRSIGINVSYGEKTDAKLKEMNADQVLPPDTQEMESLVSEKTISFEVPFFSKGDTFEIWFNEQKVGEVGKGQKLRLTTNQVRNSLYVIDKQSLNQSQTFCFKVTSEAGEGCINYTKIDKENAVFNVENRSGVIQEDF